jgi:hypothetical protein
MSFYVITNPSKSQKDEMAKLYSSLDFVYTFQHPYFPIKDNNVYFLLLDKQNKILSYCIVQESNFSKLKFIKNASLIYGVIGRGQENCKLLFDFIVNHYHHNKFTSLYYYPYHNTIDLANLTFPYVTLLTRKKDSIWIDLSLEIEEIKLGFSKMLLRNLKKAEKNSLTVRILTTEHEHERFIEINQKMSDFRGIDFNRSELEKTICFTKDFNCGYLLGCFSEDQVLLGGILVVIQGKLAEYFIAATDPSYKSLPLSHLTMLKAIEYSKQIGCEVFDLGGIVLNAEESDQVYNITNFKKLFSSNYKIYTNPIEFRFSFWKNLLKTLYLNLASR